MSSNIIERERVCLEDRLASTNGDVNGFMVDVDRGVKEYIAWCQHNRLPYHISNVHSFNDTVRQAVVCALTGKSSDEREKLAKITCYLHLFDDFIDSIGDRAKRFGNFEGDLNKFRKMAPEGANRVLDAVDLLIQNVEKRKAMNITFAGVVYGAAIEGARDPSSQRKYAKEFQDNYTKDLEDGLVRADIRKLHPSLFALINSTVLEGFFAVSDGNSWKSLAPLYNCLYAPMLYAHDADREITEEKCEIGRHAGKGLTENGKFKEDELAKLIDVFDRNIARNARHLDQGYIKQMKVAYKAFEKILSPKLRERYQLSMQKTERLLEDQNVD